MERFPFNRRDVSNKLKLNWFFQEPQSNPGAHHPLWLNLTKVIVCNSTQAKIKVEQQTARLINFCLPAKQGRHLIGFPGIHS